MTGPGTLLWAMESLFSLSDKIGFTVFDEPGTVLALDQFPQVVNVTLVSKSQNSEHISLGNLTSTTTVTVSTETIRKRVFCSDGLTPQEESPYTVIQKPCMPVGLMECFNNSCLICILFSNSSIPYGDKFCHNPWDC